MSTAALDGSPYPWATCAATLTYKVAPYPQTDLDELFDMALAHESDRQMVENVTTSAAGRWLSRAWEGVKGLTQENVVSTRQADFLRYFSRQLECNAEEFEVVMLSARCAIISMGTPVPGYMFVTNWGLYFCSEEAAVVDSQQSAASPEEVPQSEMAIKERVDFTRVASVLPSLVEARTTNDPQQEHFLSFFGVPSAQTNPTALQIFTVDPQQIYQLINIHDVVIRPPAPASTTPQPQSPEGRDLSSPLPPSGTMPRIKLVRNPEDQPAFTDVLQPSQYALVRTMPVSQDTFRFGAIMMMLWRSRLETKSLPLLHPNATFASPH